MARDSPPLRGAAPFAQPRRDGGREHRDEWQHAEARSRGRRVEREYLREQRSVLLLWSGEEALAVRCGAEHLMAGADGDE